MALMARSLRSPRDFIIPTLRRIRHPRSVECFMRSNKVAKMMLEGQASGLRMKNRFEAGGGE
jgi:hypothetical protein